MAAFYLLIDTNILNENREIFECNSPEKYTWYCSS
jgi:hypothetical protein